MKMVYGIQHGFDKLDDALLSVIFHSILRVAYDSTWASLMGPEFWWKAQLLLASALTC